MPRDQAEIRDAAKVCWHQLSFGPQEARVGYTLQIRNNPNQICVAKPTAILLYCIAKGDAPATDSLTGVAGHPVLRVELGSIAAFTSTNTDNSNCLRPQLQTSALEFYR